VVKWFACHFVLFDPIEELGYELPFKNMLNLIVGSYSAWSSGSRSLAEDDIGALFGFGVSVILCIGRLYTRLSERIMYTWCS
jgi:hypothetical protein